MYEELFQKLIEAKAQDDTKVSASMVRSLISNFLDYLETAIQNTEVHEYCIDPAFARDDKFLFAGTSTEYSKHKSDIQITSSGLLYQVLIKVCGEYKEKECKEACELLEDMVMMLLSESRYGMVREYNRARFLGIIGAVREKFYLLL